MTGLIGWLSGLPLALLYGIMAIASAVENVFPPVPADTVVAFGSWLAARGQGSVWLAFLATIVGNVAGAAAMYAVGRKHGAGWMRERFPALGDEKHEEKLRALYGKYGVVALVISRFVPGVRALVPPFAGALRVPPVLAIGAMAAASAVWYGIISYVGFTAGSDWDHVLELSKRYGTIVAIVAGALLLAGVAWWYLRRHHRTEETSG